MSISMAQSKPMGIPKQEYENAQQLKADHDFKYQTNQTIQFIQISIQNLNGMFSEVIAKLGDHKSNVHTKIREMEELIAGTVKIVTRYLDEFKKLVESNKECIKEIMVQQDDYVLRYEMVEKISMINEEIESIREHRENIQRDFKHLIDRCSQQVDAKLVAQKEEILSKPSEVIPIIKELNQKIDLVELNGQNALLRSSNNEKQIMLVERKIENLYQLLKKLDISIQESK